MRKKIGLTREESARFNHQHSVSSEKRLSLRGRSGFFLWRSRNFVHGRSSASRTPAAARRGRAARGLGGAAGRRWLAAAHRLDLARSRSGGRRARGRLRTGRLLAAGSLLAALDLDFLALGLTAAGRRGSAARRSRRTATGGGSRAAVAGVHFSDAGTHEQNGSRESCPLHVWYYSWKGTSGTETVANPRDTSQPSRNQPFAGRRFGCQLGDLNLTPSFSTRGAATHHAKGVCFSVDAGVGTVVSTAPRTRGRCNTQILKSFASPQGLRLKYPDEASAARD